MRANVLAFFVLMIPLTATAGNKDDQPYIAADTQIIAEEPPDEIVRALEEKSRHLYDILKSAYTDNPTIRAARSQLKATDERLPLALSNFGPQITADGDVTYTDTDYGGTSGGGASAFNPEGSNTSKTAAVNLAQPLYRGGRTLAETSGAKNLIKAQMAVLNATEQNIMRLVATSYMDVLRDRALLNVAENNSGVILRQLEMAQARFDVGEITKTDVSQAQARLAQAESDIAAARANLRASMAAYEQVTGAPPEENLLYPEITFELPATIDDAITAAEINNPSTLAAEFTNAAAEDDVDNVFGELLPSLNLNGGVSRSYSPSQFIDRQDTTQVGVIARIPLYESGAVRSRVRAAKHTANQRYLQILESRRAARQETISAWERLQAAMSQITAREKEVEAATFVRDSLQDQADVGERTITDALDAVQDYQRAQSALLSARRDEVVARFTLAEAMGKLTPETLGFTEQSIKPDLHLNGDAGSFLGLSTHVDSVETDVDIGEDR
jgi:outer membrane protein